MNELIEGLKMLTSEVGKQTLDLMKTVNGENDIEMALIEYYETRKKYKRITIVIFAVCIVVSFLLNGRLKSSTKI